MIFCVEDDANIRDITVYTLQSGGFLAKGFPSGSEFFEALRQEKPELILLDVMLPGEHGVDILKRLKAATSTASIPVIMATAKGSEFDKIISLDLGADDYLVKPFGMMELVSRVKAVLRRCAPRAELTELHMDDVCLNRKDHTLSVKGQRVLVTLKEFELLQLFMSQPGRVFSRDQLLSAVWGMDYDGETRTVDVHIRSLRQKLGDSAPLIETIRRVGYRMEVIRP